jgi:heme-degrading monooxygenase HmoA
MIARRWRGRVRAADLDAYLAYLEASGVPALRATPGNEGVLVFRLVDEATATVEFEVASLWRDLEDIRAFAGDDLTRARFFPEDDQFLIERELHCRHDLVTVYPAG